MNKVIASAASDFVGKFSLPPNSAIVRKGKIC